MSKAIATVVIGDRYVNDWNACFRPSWEKYAAKYGYKIVAITDPIDSSRRAFKRSYNWQKLLVLEHPELRGFDDVVWLDSDIMINAYKAPCIVSEHASDKVGLVSNKQWLYSNPELFERVMTRIGDGDFKVSDKYTNAGLPCDLDDYSNTGVMVMRPHHKEIMRHVYDNYTETPKSAKEETPLCHYLYSNGLVKAIDPRFNRPWIYELVSSYPSLLRASIRRSQVGPILLGLATTTALHNCWFLHFTDDRAGLGGERTPLRPDASAVFDCPDILTLAF